MVPERKSWRGLYEVNNTSRNIQTTAVKYVLSRERYGGWAPPIIPIWTVTVRGRLAAPSSSCSPHISRLPQQLFMSSSPRNMLESFEHILHSLGLQDWLCTMCIYVSCIKILFTEQYMCASKLKAAPHHQTSLKTAADVGCACRQAIRC